MQNKIKRAISFILSLAAFLFLIKYLYFDTKIGLSTEILNLTAISAPLFIESLVMIIVFPFIVFSICEQICDSITEKVKKIKKLYNNNIN